LQKSSSNGLSFYIAVIFTVKMTGFDNSGVFVTGEMEDRFAFHAGIFVTRANTLVPFAVHAESADFQVSNQINEEFAKAGSTWASCAVPAGIGQYSLFHGPAGLVARSEAYFRPVTPDEAEWDFDMYGDQVLGPRVEDVPEDEREGKVIIPFLGRDHVYEGPSERLLKMVFVTRFFQGEIPEDITDLVKEVDGAVPDLNLRKIQKYDFFHAENGRAVGMAFRKPEDFDPTKLEHFGDVEIMGKTRLWFYPKGEKDKAIDMSGYRRQYKM
jgi:hypothetical protein